VSEYAYNVPVERSQYHFSSKGGGALMGYDGTFLLDPKSIDLVNLVVRATEPPSDSGACLVTNTLDYGRVRIRDTDLLLPTETRLRIVNKDGIETENRTEYSGCHEFLGESTVKFDSESSDAGAATGKPLATAVTILPPQLRFSVKITRDIDTATAAAGDPVSAELIGPIVDDSAKVLAPAGAAVTGRIVRIQHFYGPRPSVMLIWKTESVEIRGKAVPLAARTLGLDTGNDLVVNIRKAGANYVIRKGVESDWITAADGRR
jgi:hypothetical protein